VKTINNRLDNIKGIVLTNSEKADLNGGDEIPGGTCAFMDPEGYVYCNLSRSEALFYYEPYGPGSGAHWCCDSCSETWWWKEGCGSGGQQ
jgi:hypothetical protein